MNAKLAVTRFLLPVLLASTPALLASTARADGLDVRVQHKHVSVGLSLGHAPRPVCPPRPIGYESREWIPGHYETVVENVWIPGCEERVWVPPVYEWRTDACGRPHKVLVRGGCHEVIRTPGRFEARERRVWVEGGWRVRHCR